MTPAAEERFKEIQQAYDALSDPEKRKQYDAGGRFGGFGAGGFPGGAGAGGFPGGGFASDIGDIFSTFFRGGRQQGPREQRGRDLETEVRLSFDQAMHGTQIAVSVPTTGPCPTCSGSGAKPGTSPRTCPRCEGTGIDAQSQGLFSISQPCPECGGQGEMIDDPCPTCGGQGITQETKRYRVNIPAGVHDGSRIRLAGKGEAGYRGGPRGDLYVTTRVAPSPVFKQRPDGNLEVDLPVTVAEAIQGADDRGPDARRVEDDSHPPGHPARHRPAAARRGPAPDQGLRARRHLLPDPDRRPKGAFRRAARGGREAGRGAQRPEPARIAARSGFNGRHKHRGWIIRCRGESADRWLIVRVAKRREGERRIDQERGVFMISVAAELAEMHPQTLRMYEARGLITPKRSPKNTRLYSQADVERLRRIQQMTNDEGLNLAGVETVLELERRLERMRADMAKMRKRAAEMESRMTQELERLRKSIGGELVPYGAYEPRSMGHEPGSTRIPIRRRSQLRRDPTAPIWGRAPRAAAR